MKDQKTLKALYMDIISNEVWPKSPDMIKYADKKAAWIVEINNGDIVEIEKPSIDKDFCFLPPSFLLFFHFLRLPSTLFRNLMLCVCHLGF